MAFTYSGDPSASDRDAVRFMIQDTDSTDPLMQDAEVDWVLTQAGGSVYQAAHDACYALASKFARKADQSKSVGNLSLSLTYSNRAAEYTALGDRFMELAARREVPTPWVNAEAIAIPSSRTSTPTTDFTVGMFDNYRR